MKDSRFVIVGGGLGGAKMADELRHCGYPGSIVLVGAESHLPYERPPLSKDYLAGTADRASLAVHDLSWYVDHDVDLRLGEPATQLDRDAHEVVLRDGTRLGYDQLVLATGSRARRLHLPGSDAGGVLYLRDVDDSDALRAGLDQARRIVLIGAGWIGLEVAANARQRGVEVDVVEVAPLPLLRVLGADLAQMFADLHGEHGVRFHFEASVAGIEVDGGRATGVTLGDGTRLPADLVVVGVGAQPNVDLAREAGLEVDNGVLVDQYLRTTDPDIYAVGDIAAQAHPRLGRVRVEHWANALNQPAAVAATVTGTLTPYSQQPYFYTDQYDLAMEYHGYVPPGVEPTVVIRGDRATRELLAFWLSPTGKVLAGMNLNIWDAEDQIKALLDSGPVDPRRLSDLGLPLERVLPFAAAQETR
ncbi:MAG: FAD-dependent oxidoreductase [Microlunatus sp.]|nr:FAD-dependent oxidoreductase [Microlunatus sp.]MDN5769930.1 FAD-dependent oxidoreductase [Microlunatus sp.]